MTGEELDDMVEATLEYIDAVTDPDVMSPADYLLYLQALLDNLQTRQDAAREHQS